MTARRKQEEQAKDGRYKQRGKMKFLGESPTDPPKEKERENRWREVDRQTVRLLVSREEASCLLPPK